MNIDAAVDAKSRVGKLAKSTFTSSVLADIGTFGALYRFEKNKCRNPVLVSSCDGVGTKLKIAFMTGRHNTVGYDLVSHCVSDILVQGARPLFFLDYIAFGTMKPDVVEQVVAGLARGCKEAGCPLIGGETAEMPDVYSAGEYDLAGFIVGLVDREKLITGSGIKPGDRLLGLASVGLHTNGYSLARKLFFERLALHPDDAIAELKATVADILLAPHKMYFPLIEPLLDSSIIKGMAHITGGGITDNLPRILPDGTAARIMKGRWPVLPVFKYIQQKGEIEDNEMYRTFNMGIGMILVVSEDDVPAVEKHMALHDEPVYKLGAIVVGNRCVEYE